MKTINEDNTSKTRIDANTYDELGQLKKKALGYQAGTTEALASLNYDFNIRGWLLSINKNFVEAENPVAGQYFGIELGYDQDAYGSFTKHQYNGNISGNDLEERRR